MFSYVEVFQLINEDRIIELMPYHFLLPDDLMNIGNDCWWLLASQKDNQILCMFCVQHHP